MQVWLITVGEPLPIDGPQTRLYRTGILAHHLASKGHKVTWWTSTFDHFTKKQRFDRDTDVHLETGIRLKLLHGPSYTRNISVRRLINHQILGLKLKGAIRKEAKPDIIFCSFPTIELSSAAVRFGRQSEVPVVLDVRDLWPDIFLDITHTELTRNLSKVLLKPFFRETAEAFQSCRAIVGVSRGYLDWGLKYARRDPTPMDRVFPLGYSPPEISPREVEAGAIRLKGMGVDPSKKICWFSGSFGRTYDLSTVVRAARILQERSDLQFVFCGDGELMSTWKQEAEGLSNVIFTGWMGTSELAWLMRNARIGIAAYAKGAPQGLPNKIFEYLAAGLPILSSLRGETETLLAQNSCGLTYDASSSASLANSIRTLADNDDQLAGLGHNGKRLFEENYSHERVYSGLENYLSEIQDSSQ